MRVRGGGRFGGMLEVFHATLGGERMAALRRAVGPRAVWTVGGDQCTGKSTLAGRLARQCFGRHISAGAHFREVAARRGVDVAELSRLAAGDPAVDVEIEYMLCMSIAEGCADSAVLVVEGRMPGLLALMMEEEMGKEGCRRVFLHCSIREQAVRFVEREVGVELARLVSSRLPEREYASVAEAAAGVREVSCDRHWAEQAARAAAALEQTATRDDDDVRRLRELYALPSGLDYRRPGLYHHVIDTTENMPEDTLAAALECLCPGGAQR